MYDTMGIVTAVNIKHAMFSTSCVSKIIYICGRRGKTLPRQRGKTYLLDKLTAASLQS